jgi:hypothetical protein
VLMGIVNIGQSYLFMGEINFNVNKFNYLGT